MKVAIVTGGSRGIGKECAKRLARDGMCVVVGYASNKSEADKVVSEIVMGGARAIAVQADVADEEAVARMFERAMDEFGGVDVVINCAGIMALGAISELDIDALDRMYRTNIRGAFLVSKHAAKNIRSGGNIINISTSAGKQAMNGYAPYSATKAAVDAISLILARELRGKNITVNAVAPGPTATELFMDGKSEELVDKIAKFSPMERLGTTEDIANTVSFLVGEGRWINGQTIYVNGGMN